MPYVTDYSNFFVQEIENTLNAARNPHLMLSTLSIGGSLPSIQESVGVAAGAYASYVAVGSISALVLIGTIGYNKYQSYRQHNMASWVTNNIDTAMLASKLAAQLAYIQQAVITNNDKPTVDFFEYGELIYQRVQGMKKLTYAERRGILNACRILDYMSRTPLSEVPIKIEKDSNCEQRVILLLHNVMKYDAVIPLPGPRVLKEANPEETILSGLPGSWCGISESEGRTGWEQEIAPPTQCPIPAPRSIFGWAIGGVSHVMNYFSSPSNTPTPSAVSSKGKMVRQYQVIDNTSDNKKTPQLPRP